MTGPGGETAISPLTGENEPAVASAVAYDTE